MTCGTASCRAEGVLAFVWPGREAQAACVPCWMRAFAIAYHMGFELSTVPLARVERPLAEDTLKRLGG